MINPAKAGMEYAKGARKGVNVMRKGAHVPSSLGNSPALTDLAQNAHKIGASKAYIKGAEQVPGAVSHVGAHKAAYGAGAAGVTGGAAGGGYLYSRRSSHGGIDHTGQQHWNR